MQLKKDYLTTLQKSVFIFSDLEGYLKFFS